MEEEAGFRRRGVYQQVKLFPLWLNYDQGQQNVQLRLRVDPYTKDDGANFLVRLKVTTLVLGVDRREFKRNEIFGFFPDTIQLSIRPLIDETNIVPNIVIDFKEKEVKRIVQYGAAGQVRIIGLMASGNYGRSLEDCEPLSSVQRVGDSIEWELKWWKVDREWQQYECPPDNWRGSIPDQLPFPGGLAQICNAIEIEWALKRDMQHLPLSFEVQVDSWLRLYKYNSPSSQWDAVQLVWATPAELEVLKVDT